MRSLIIRLLSVAALSMLAGCSGGDGGGSALPLPGLGASAAYDVSIEGDMPSELRDKLEKASQLIALRTEAPSSRAALRRRVADDVNRLGAVLRAEGYYGGALDAKTDVDSDPPAIVLRVKPGVQYKVMEYDILYGGNYPGMDALPRDGRKFEYSEGMPARGEAVVAIEEALIDDLHRNGRPKARILDRKAVVNHDTHAMTVTLRVDPGPPAVFGSLDVKGLKQVDKDYVRFIIDSPKGKQWDEDELDDVRTRLAETNLFRAVHIDPADEVSADGQLPVSVTLEEAKPRTIAAGINYSTDEGPGGEVSWEHRNLLGRQELLRLFVLGSAVRQQATAEFRKPNFYLRDLDLLTNVTALAQQTDAFDERTGSAFVGLEKRFGEVWRVRAGISSEYSIIRQDGEESNYAILGLPMRVSRDGTDDLLNPTEGTRFRLSATPYFATIAQDVSFSVFEAEASAYYALDEQKRVVPAIRLRTGTIVGADLFSIPITKRFFAGGGGSVRGYGYQLVGPLDIDGDPTGGLSVLETGLEMRWRVTDNIGIVPFVDGGNVYETRSPDFSENLFWAAGVGFRYYTVAGPVRLDVAIPLNRREGIDDRYEIYVSLGQAF